MQKISLAEKDSKPFEWAHISGWGFMKRNQTTSEELRTATVEIIERDLCPSEFYGAKNPGRFCSGLGDCSKICKGNSESSLIVGSRLVGIATMAASRYGEGNVPGLCTSVAYYKFWKTIFFEKNVNESFLM